MPLLNRIALLFLCVSVQWANGQKAVFQSKSGQVHFRSEAPLELIEGVNTSLRGVIDTAAGTFAFTLSTIDFTGFNSALQQEHFHENYLESNRFPRAIFKGRILDNIQWNGGGVQSFRVKGILTIHGVDQERIIVCEWLQLNKEYRLQSSFKVPLVDHNITIPRVVKQKIAEEILVQVMVQF